jgi:threonine/homoserine/homoserine lactone efflux protein
MNNEIFFRGLGLVGGAILIATGLSFILSNPVKNLRKGRSVNKKNLLGYFIVGILINGINPFTIVFWLGLLTTYVAPLTKGEVNHVLFGIMGTIVLTDSLKVVLAKKISKKLKRRLIIKLRRLAGIILVICGIGLIIRVMIH